MKQESIIIIIGLGNPGKLYEKTRHNVGFRVVDALKRHYLFSPWKISETYCAFISVGKIAGKKVVLAKPYTFMNNSGKTAKKLTANYKLPTANLLVIHDDISLSLGTLRIVKNRGSAGHQGVNSIIESLGTKDFVRLRIGTGRKTIKNVKEFVLQKFTPAEEKILKKVITKSLAVVELALQDSLSRAMTEYNE